MANCFVGDIQGCYDDLRRLLDLAEFDSDKDTLCGKIGQFNSHRALIKRRAILTV